MTKFVFANQLRGIAALLVVMTHYFGTFFAEQDLLAARTFSPNLHLQPAAWTHLFELPYQGPFGVAIFFLISGFVIPYSLKKTSLPGFLLNRVLRIFPTYACCLGLGTLAIYLSARYWGQDFSYQPKVLIANALLVHNYLGLPSMDAVNWTLAIEIKFYLLAAIGAAALFRRGPGWLLAFLAMAALYTWSWVQGWDMHHPRDISTGIAMELNYVVFMMAGIQFYQHAAGLISTRALQLRCVLVLATFCFTWSVGPQQGQFPSITWFYLGAFAVFSMCYARRERFRPLRVLDFLADISYPLYCVHSLFGYCALKILIDRGLPYGAAVVLTLATAMALAYAIHLTIENGSNQLGKRWGAALSRRKLAAAAAA